jgi:hypothetical protein
MHRLQSRLKPLLDSEDIDGLTTLLEAWQPRDAFWRSCVESRLWAPSSSAEHRQRLRALLKAHDLSPPEVSVASLVAEFKTAAALPPPDEPGVVLSVDELIPELETALADAAKRISALPAEAARPACEVLERVRSENDKQQRLRREQFEDDLKRRRLPRGSRFSEFLASVARHFVQLGPAATADEISALQAMAPAALGDGLRAFYTSFGGIRGDFGEDGISLQLCSPRELLDAHHSREPWRRLSRLSLLGMARWSWGNDRPELEPGQLPPTVERAASECVCVGWLMDGGCEQHAHLVQRADGRFQVHLWHQDDDFTASAAEARHAADLLPLLAKLLYLIPHSQDTGQSDFGLEELVAALDSSEP